MSKEVVKIGRYIEFEHEDGICENMLLLTEKETSAMEKQLKKSYEYEQQIDKLTNNWNELEKDINNQLMMTREFNDYNEGYFDATLHYYNKMKELKENNNG